MRADDGTCFVMGMIGTGSTCCKRRDRRGLLVGSSVELLMGGRCPGSFARVVRVCVRGLARRVRGLVGLVDVVMVGGLYIVSTLSPSELAGAPSELGTGGTLSIGASSRASNRSAFAILLINFFLGCFFIR